MSSNTAKEKKIVVIIGHGLSGRSVAVNLVKQLPNDLSVKIIAVDSREFYECDATITVPITWGGDGSYTQNSSPQWKLAVPGVSEYICDTVRSVTKNGKKLSVGLTEGDRTIRADVVVAATSFHMPVVKPSVGMAWKDRKRELTAYREAIAKARDIVVAGAGSAGLDLAGDVRMFNSGANIHLIVSDSKYVLHDRFGEGDRKMMTDVVKNSPGMVLHMNERVVGDNAYVPSFEPSTVTLKSGKTIEADVYIPCFVKWNGGGYLKSLSGATSPNGLVAQDHRTLQSKVNPALFAIGCGDIIEKEGWSGIPKLEAQAKTVSTNVLNFLMEKTLIDHKEGMSFSKHEPAVHFGHGFHTALLTEKCGLPGKCCVLCGFPFPCILCPCLPCGISCMKPNGNALKNVVKDFACNKGGQLNMDARKFKGAAPPSSSDMSRQ